MLIVRPVAAAALLLMAFGTHAWATDTPPRPPGVEVELGGDGSELNLGASTPGRPGGQPSGGGSTVPTGTGNGPAPTPVDPKDPDDTQCPGAAVVLDATSC